MYLAIIEPHEALYRYLEVAKRKGYQTLVVTSDPASSAQGEEKYNLSIRGTHVSRIDKFLTCDVGSAASVLQTLMPLKNKIKGIVAGHEIFVPLVAEIGVQLGFDYAPSEDAICQQLKTAMKKRLVERGVRTARFSVCNDLNEAIAAWKTFGGDCITKMVNYVGSMNVFRVRSEEDLRTAWDIIINDRRNVKTPFPKLQQVIVEEYISGRELSVEGYVQDDRVVVLNSCEKITGPNFVVIGHLLPSELSASEKEKLNDIARQCVLALGIRNSVFHAEVHIREGVPYVIECASRPPGLHVAELISRSYNFDLMEISIDLATGKKVSVTPRPAQLHYAMMALYSEQTGTLRKITGLDELQARGGVLRVHLGVKEGNKVEALSTFRSKCGFAILEDSTPEGVREKADWLRKNVRFEVVPAVPEHLAAAPA
jgi:biotin carboxylase